MSMMPNFFDTAQSTYCVTPSTYQPVRLARGCRAYGASWDLFTYHPSIAGLQGLFQRVRLRQNLRATVINTPFQVLSG